jgi:hypothetical protein
MGTVEYPIKVLQKEGANVEEKKKKVINIDELTIYADAVHLVNNKERKKATQKVEPVSREMSRRSPWDSFWGYRREPAKDEPVQEESSE